MRTELLQVSRYVRIATSTQSIMQSNLMESHATPVLSIQRNTAMTQDMQCSEEEQKLMMQYGITHEKTSVYFYQGHKYGRLSDAIKYARDSSARKPTAASTSPD